MFVNSLILACTAGLFLSVCNAQCANTTTTISNSADMAALATCTTFTGTIAVATDSVPVVELDGIEVLDGDFLVQNNTAITTVGSAGLKTVTGTVQFYNLTSLFNITLPNWESTGTLILENMPGPSVVNFQQNGQQIYQIYVKNTTMAFFTGLTLEAAQIQVLEIVNNPYLQTIAFEAGNITQHATIQNNGPGCKVSLPNLTYAYSLEITNVSEVSIPMLQSVSNGLDASWNDVSNLSIPELEYVGGDLHVNNNPSLSKLDLHNLVSVSGELEVENNPELADLTGFSLLSTVGNAMDLIGAFTSVALPTLRLVRGDILIESTNTLNCSGILPSTGTGTYACHANQPKAPLVPPASSRGGLTAGAKAGIAIGAIGVAAVLALAVTFYLFRRKNAARTAFQHGQPQLMEGDQEERRVLDVNKSDIYEMGTLPPYEEKPDDTQSCTDSTMAEMGRDGHSHPGPENRHEMPMEPPAAHELP